MKFQTKIQMKKIYSVLLVLLCSIGYSQNYKAEIANVKQSGLSQITIDPKVRAFAKDDLRYFRILDKDNNQVPYAFVSQKRQSESYSPFKIVSKNSIADSITTLVIQNEKRSKWSSLSLQIENTSLTKVYSISGSNDGIKWFGLVQDALLTDLESSNGTSVSKMISFPANTYGYLSIVLNDKKSLPINLLSVGVEKTQLIPEQLVPIADFSYTISEDKQEKLTKINFKAQNDFQIDAISFAISTAYYSRNARIVATRKQEIKRKVRYYDENIADFNLNSKSDRTIYFNTLSERNFTIEIENQDNQPLNITSIQVLQKPIIIVSTLNKGEKYRVVIDSTYSKPSYDLGNFVASTALNFPEVTLSNFMKVNAENKVQAEKQFWQTKLFMWICIILGGSIVGYFAFGLLKDMKEE